MTAKTSAGEELSPIIFYYFNITGTESYCRQLENYFRQSGHERPIVFKEWNCYKDLPGVRSGRQRLSASRSEVCCRR